MNIQDVLKGMRSVQLPGLDVTMNAWADAIETEIERLRRAEQDQWHRANQMSKAWRDRGAEIDRLKAWKDRARYWENRSDDLRKENRWLYAEIERRDERLEDTPK